MKTGALLAGCLLVPALLYGETSVWSRIENISQFDTPHGNPQLEAYLKSLTRPQMLDAVRECCIKAEERVPKEQWAEGVVPAALAMVNYGNREGGLPDDALSLLLDCIASEQEGELFRETMLRLLRQRFWEQMTDDQRGQSRLRFLAVLSDKKAPERLRVLSCRELAHATNEHYRRVIISDKNVRPLRSDKQKWQRVDDLIRTGEVRLESETRKALNALRDEIANITPTLTALSKDAAESAEVKDCARSALKTFDDLPAVPEI